MGRQPTPTIAAMALGDLGVLCSDLGDLAAARAALERAIASGHPVRGAPGRVQPRRAAAQSRPVGGGPRRLPSGPSTSATRFTVDAVLALGHLEVLTDRLEQAVACYVQVITTAAEEQASIAAARLVSSSFGWHG